MINHEQLRQIVYKVLDGSASSGEQSLLRQYLKTVDELTALSVLFPDEELLADPVTSLSDDERRDMLASVLHDAERQHTAADGRMVQLFPRKGKYAWMAAASVAVIIILGAGFLFFNHNRKTDNIASLYKEQVSSPGQTTPSSMSKYFTR